QNISHIAGKPKAACQANRGCGRFKRGRPMSERALVPVERIARAIHKLRGHNVMLDSDLAGLYNVPVKVLNQAVKRNRERFPPDFMCVRSVDDAESLRSQSVPATRRRGGRRTAPYAFTEQGVAMLSSVLRGSQ